MNGNMIWDPLRKKEVPLTPEERVRQWFITMLRDTMHVPAHMMMSEVGLKYGAGTAKKEYRADIVVYDRKLDPAMIVECKRPDITLTQETLEQALRYDMVLNVRYIVITNGKSTFIARKDGDHLEFMTRPPLWEEIIQI